MIKRPLAGKRILVTRAIEQAEALTGSLKEVGALPILCPTIEIVPPASYAELDDALRDLAGFDYLLMTSANAVSAFFERLIQNGLGLDALKSLQVVAVGPKTASAMAAKGRKADLIPVDYRAEGVVALLRGHVKGKRLLYPKAAIARDLIIRELTACQADVVAPDVYSSIPPAKSKAILHQALTDGLDLIILTASSTVHNLVELARPEDLPQLKSVPVASIGPITTTTCRELGFQVLIEPEDSTINALFHAIVDHYTDSRQT